MSHLNSRIRFFIATGGRQWRNGTSSTPGAVPRRLQLCERFGGRDFTVVMTTPQS